jgi:hypothetical protein
MIRRRLAPRLQQHRHVNKIRAVPRRPRIKSLQPFAARIDSQCDIAPNRRWRNIARNSALETIRWHVRRGLRRFQLEPRAVSRHQRVGQRIER